MSEKNKNFVRGAALLGLAGIIVKIIGAGFRIPLGYIFGTIGFSYYQTAYPIYNWLLVISTAGIPTAIAKLISEKEALNDTMGVHRIFKTAFWLLLGIGLGTMTLLMIMAKQICIWVGNPDAVYSMIAIAPALFFVSLLSVYRGYFNGIQKVMAYGVSQVIEQVFRVFFGLGLAIYLLQMSVPYAAAGATFAASIGGFAGTIYMVVYYRRHRKKQGPIVEKTEFEPQSSSEIIKKLFMIAIPVSIGASVLPIMNLIDLSMVMNRLQEIGFSQVQAQDLYGQLTGYALTVVNLPMIITAAVQISLVPAVTQYVVLKDKKELNKIIETGIRMGLIIALPCTIGLVMLGKPIMLLLYPKEPISAQGAGTILSLLGWGVLGLSMFQVLTGLLQGLGKVWIPARNLAVAAAFKLILSYIFLGIKSVNIYGAAGTTAFAYLLAAGLNYLSLSAYSEEKIKIRKVFLKPLVAVGVMAVVVQITYMSVSQVVGNSLSTLITVAISGVAYGLTLIAIKALSDEDYQMLPGGSKLKKVADLIHRRK